ncbi:MAG: HAMP domain-containing sensor histidine kinase [Ignavibacteria bacterium]|jgi:signal transduction histidine kinase
MIRLVPTWAQHYDEFWAAIRRRNLWFIKLRYLAGIMLFAFLFAGEYLLNFRLTNIQFYAILIIAFTILLYNGVINYSRKFVHAVPGKFNCLHLSLVQMILDLILLMLLVYFTGTINSPLYMFFIFHMIIGSLILPGYVVYSIGYVITIVFSALVILQYYKIIETHVITGLFTSGHIPQSFAYNVLFAVVFGAMMLISVYLANKITYNLYKREQQLRETLDQLKEAEVTKQKYIMGVVHEIKSPISAVKSMLDLILQKFLGPVDQKIEEKLERSRIRTDEALQLINNVLRISKLKLLNVSASEEINLKELIRGIIDKNYETAAAKKIDLVFNDNIKFEKKLKGDRILLELAFSNLIGNSIKYNKTNGLVDISFVENEEDVVVEIADNGVGIPQSEHQAVFMQFYRATNIKKGSTEGSGLGLSLVKEIIERHKGSISIKSPSKIGNSQRPGTSFFIKLPTVKLETTPKKTDKIPIIGSEL